MKNIKIAIGVPLSHNSVPIEFFESFIQMKKPVSHMFLRAGGYQGVDSMRNQLVKAAMQYSCTHILFLDVDHRHHPDTIPKLLSHNLPIVSGLSYMRNDPYEPCLFRGIINNYKTVTEWEDGELIEVDSVGGACLLVDIEVLKKIKDPFLKFMENPDPTVEFAIGEDVYFCNRAKQEGYKIYVDTSIQNSHLGIVEVNKEFSEKWNGRENGTQV